MPYKDGTRTREYQKEWVRQKRGGKVRQAEGSTDINPVIPKVTSSVIPVEDLIPKEPYDEAAALKHMMSMHPVYSDKMITTSGGVRCRPVIGWQEGEAWKPTPIVAKVDRTRLARLKKVIKGLELVKVVEKGGRGVEVLSV